MQTFIYIQNNEGKGPYTPSNQLLVLPTGESGRLSVCASRLLLGIYLRDPWSKNSISLLRRSDLTSGVADSPVRSDAKIDDKLLRSDHPGTRAAMT